MIDIAAVVRPDHAGFTLLHRVGDKSLTEVSTTGPSVWWVWCWGQSLSLPESVHIWAAATSGTIKAANKRNVGQADEYFNVMTEHMGWINVLIQHWPNKSYVGPLRLNEDIIKKTSIQGWKCGHKVNSKWILISDTNKPLLCLFFASVQEVSSAAWVIIDGLYSHFIFHWACNGVRISLSDVLLAFYHLFCSPQPTLSQLSLPQPQIDAHRDVQNNKKWARVCWADDVWHSSKLSTQGGKFSHFSECLYARMFIDHGFCATDSLMDSFDLVDFDVCPEAVVFWFQPALGNSSLFTFAVSV